MTAPAFIYTSEPWAALSFWAAYFSLNVRGGGEISAGLRPQSSSASRFTAGASEFFILTDGRDPTRNTRATDPRAFACLSGDGVSDFDFFHSRGSALALESGLAFALPLNGGLVPPKPRMPGAFFVPRQCSGRPLHQPSASARR
jgi:hypothetical protein